MTQSPLKVALLGCGTVGNAVARIILEKGDELAARIGRPMELTGVVVRDAEVDRPGVPPELLTSDADALLASGVDILVELVGGISPAREWILTGIANGCSIVTANKALLAAHGREVFQAAKDAGVDVYYEAAVAGAIPIVRPLRESLVGDEIISVMGIVNGTTNYILDKMATEKMDYGTALAQAQELGYAEADPSADVEGHDAAAKAALLASLAFHTWVQGEKVHCEGITDITPTDIAAADEVGCVIKLLAAAKKHPDGRIGVRVHPTMVPVDHPLASVSGAYNAVFIEAASAGRLMFLGPGAGGNPTASAVVGDLVTVARHRKSGMVGSVQSMYADREVADLGSITSRYFIRMTVRDEPGVLASIASVLAEHDISIQTVIQSPCCVSRGKGAVLYLLTHQAIEADLVACLNQLAGLSTVLGPVRMLRVEGT